MVGRVPPSDWGSIHGPSGFEKVVPQAIAKAQDIESRINKVAELLAQEANGAREDTIRPQLSEEFRTIGNDIDELKKMLPPNSPVLDHLDTEFQYLSSHQDTFNTDQVTEFGLISSRLVDELNQGR